MDSKNVASIINAHEIIVLEAHVIPTPNAQVTQVYNVVSMFAHCGKIVINVVSAISSSLLP